MLADLCPHFPEVRARFDTADRDRARAGRRRACRASTSSAVPGPRIRRSGRRDGGQRRALGAVGAATSSSSGSGSGPTPCVGHSSGEFLALAAAGVLRVDRRFEDRLGELGSVFERLEDVGRRARGARWSRWPPTGRGSRRSAARSAPVAIAMDNCPHQVVVAGPPRRSTAVVGPAPRAGHPLRGLPFARAYHTPGFAPALGPLVRVLRRAAAAAAASPALLVRDRRPDARRRRGDPAAGGRAVDPAGRVPRRRSRRCTPTAYGSSSRWCARAT